MLRYISRRSRCVPLTCSWINGGTLVGGRLETIDVHGDLHVIRNAIHAFAGPVIVERVARAQERILSEMLVTR